MNPRRLTPNSTWDPTTKVDTDPPRTSKEPMLVGLLLPLLSWKDTLPLSVDDTLLSLNKRSLTVLQDPL